MITDMIEAMETRTKEQKPKEGGAGKWGRIPLSSLPCSILKYYMQQQEA